VSRAVLFKNKFTSVRSWILIPVSKNNKTTPLIHTSAANPSTPPTAPPLMSPVMLLKLFSSEFTDLFVLFLGEFSSIFIVFVPANGTSFLVLVFNSPPLPLSTSTLSLFD
jgi:hypothetical protein